MDFTTRMFVRDYAFLQAVRPHQSSQLTYNFALVATGLWLLAVAGVCLVLVNVLFADYIPDVLGLLTTQKWLSFGQFALLAFLVNAYVEGKARPYQLGISTEILRRFSSPTERLKWWCTSLSIVPITGVLAWLVYIGKCRQMSC
jgi:hypothetical protein